MSKFMTIQDFSERTGVSKSALRYYESINLLHSVERNSSGYRVYSDDQVEKIKLISSLRLADVPIKDIQMYLKEDDDKIRQKMMDSWIQMIKARLDILNVSLRYLESDSANNQFYLIEKTAETIVWFLAESKTGKFGEYFIKRGKELEKLNIPIKSCYLKYLSGKDLIKAQIGFGVPSAIQTSRLTEIGIIEQMASCICIALPFHEPITEIQKGYQKLITYANDNKWIPTGSVLEWYRGDDFTDINLIMPVTQMSKRGDM
ncbi:MerR family transcriptional regulator [Heyndrickxia vini]|uniref:MerR family transcriptional regulator n=1 Tax=Heyndrickxia vini TaxID=1476025 RepID=A0ABX7E248_9BACI|nr:MerR family transcriptional regulator [Heyndrickxia vini]QQZ09405.1 MerR family transcriptional regulator [Heyndrickxia vini]